MKKQRKNIKIGTDKSHSKAMLKNLASSLIFHEAIETTKPRAKAVSAFVERLITHAKKDNLGSKRLVFDRLRNRKATKKLIEVIAPRLSDRNSGYISILRTMGSKGDDTELFRVMFIDYEPKKKKSKRTKSSKKDEKAGEKKGGKNIIDRVRGRKSEDKAGSQVKATDKSKAKSRSGI